jgi:hypothetical protein
VVVGAGRRVVPPESSWAVAGGAADGAGGGGALAGAVTDGVVGVDAGFAVAGALHLVGVCVCV